jgi:hypothetical protein
LIEITLMVPLPLFWWGRYIIKQLIALCAVCSAWKTVWGPVRGYHSQPDPKDLTVHQMADHSPRDASAITINEDAGGR